MRDITMSIIGVFAMGLGFGCQEPAPPGHVAVPPSDVRPIPSMREGDPIKPLPHQTLHAELPPPPYFDQPLLNQPPPEQPAFVAAYNHVGRPRIVVFMMAAKSLDYEAVETSLADWIASNGQITMISPMLVRQRLTEDQVRDLQNGQPHVLNEVAQQLSADVLIQVQAQPIEQARDSMKLGVFAEAMNTRGGESIGRAFVEAPLPVEKTDVSSYTRRLARKLMDELTTAWNLPLPPQEIRPPTSSPAGQ